MDVIFEKGFLIIRSIGLGFYYVKNIVIENKWEILVNIKV